MQEQIAIDIFINSTKSAKSVGEVKTAFEQLKKTTDSANTSIDEAGNKSENLKQKLRAMTIELQGLEPGTERFNSLTREAGALRDQIADTNAVINATAGSAGENLGKGLGTATKIGVAGFQGMQSAAALFGGESENLQKTLVQLQAVAGLSSAIESLGGLSDQITNMKASFGAFFQSAKAGLTGIKGAVAATGIGALIVAVGLLVAYWDDIKAAATGVSKEMQKQAEDAKKATEREEKKLETLNLQENAMRLAGKSEKEILRFKINQTGQVIKKVELEMEANRKNTKAQEDTAIRNQKILKGILMWLQAPLLGLLTAIDEIANLIPGVESDLAGSLLDWESKLIFDPGEIRENGDKAYNEMKDKVNKLKSEQEGYEVEIQRIEKQAEAERKALRKKNKEDAEKTAEEIAENNKNLIQKTEDAKIAAIKDEEQRELLRLETDLKRQKEEIDNMKASAEEKAAAKLALDEKYEMDKNGVIDKFQKQRKVEEDRIAKEEADARIQRRKDEIDAMAAGQEKELAQLEFANAQKIMKYDEEAKAIKEKLKEIDEAKAAGKITDDEYKSRQEELLIDERSNADIKLKIEEAYQVAVTDIKKKYSDIQAEADKKRNAEELNATKQKIDEIGKMTSDAVGAIGAMQEASLAMKLQGVEKGSEKEKQIQKKGFEANKRVQIAGAVVSGLQAAVAAWFNGMSIPPPLGGPVLAGIQTGISLAATGAQIAKIKATSFNSSSVSSGGVGGGGGGAEGGGGANVPQFNPGQFFGLGQSGGMNGGAEGGTKSVVYVGDINRVQNKVEVIENRATLGQ